MPDLFDIPTLPRPTGAETRTLRAAVRTHGVRKKKRKPPQVPRTTGTPNDPHPPPGVSLLQHRTLQAMTGMRWPYGSAVDYPTRQKPTMAQVFGGAPAKKWGPIRGMPSAANPYANRGVTPPSFVVEDVQSPNVPEDNTVSTSGIGGVTPGASMEIQPKGSPISKSYFGRGQPSEAAARARLLAAYGTGDEAGMLDSIGKALGGPVSDVFTWSGRAESAITYGGSALANAARGHFDQAANDALDSLKSSALFAEPILKGPWSPLFIPDVASHLVRGKGIDLSPGTTPDVLWASDTLAGQKVNEQVYKIPVVGGAAKFGTSMLMDVLADPLSYTGIGAGGTIARGGARRAIINRIGSRFSDKIAKGDVLEVTQKDLMEASGRAQQAADSVDSHLTAYARVPFSRTPIPWYKMQYDASGKATGRQLVNLNKRELKQRGFKPQMRDEVTGKRVPIDTTGLGERGLGYAYTFRAPEWLRYATKYTKGIRNIERADEESRKAKILTRAKLSAMGITPPPLTRNERFANWYYGNQAKIREAGGKATGRAQHAVQSFDKFMRPTTSPQIKAIKSATMLTGSSGRHARDLASIWATGTKLANATSAKFISNYLQPIVEKLKTKKIDEDWFSRLIDDPSNPEYSIKKYAMEAAPDDGSKLNEAGLTAKQQDIVLTVQAAVHLHNKLDQRLKRFAKANGLIPAAGPADAKLAKGFRQNYYPRFGKNMEMTEFLMNNDVVAGSTATHGPMRKDFMYQRVNDTIGEVEQKFDDFEGSKPRTGLPWEEGATARHPKHRWRSNVVETEYSKGMQRHIGDMTFAATQRNMYEAYMNFRGGMRRPATDFTEELSAARVHEAERKAERDDALKRDKAEAESAKVGVKDTKADTREAAAELRGDEKAFHEAPSKRQKKLNTFRNKLAQLAKSALKRADEGYDPSGKGGVEVAHTKLRAEAEKLANDLGELASDASSPEQVGDIARAAMRAVDAADAGNAALASEIMGLVDKRITDMIQVVEDLGTQGAKLGAPTFAVTGPGAHKVWAPGVTRRDFPLEELPARLKGYQMFGEDFPRTRQRAGMRSARNLRTQAAERAARKRGETALGADGMRHDPTPTKQQQKAWATTFEGRTPDRIAEANERVEVGVEEARRRAGDEMAAAQRGLQEALKGRSQDAIKAARARLREAERAFHKELMRLGAARGTYMATPRQAIAKQKAYDKAVASRQDLQRKQARFERHKERMPSKPMQEAASMEEWNARIAELEAGDMTQQFMAAQAKRTGFIIPQDAQKAFREWTDRTQYSLKTPAELKGYAKAFAGIQATWKRLTLASTRRLIRDSLEDSILLAIEGVRNPAIIGHTLRIMAMQSHEKKIEGKAVGIVRGITEGLAGKLVGSTMGMHDRYGNFHTYANLKTEMEHTGVNDMGQVQETMRSGVITPGGQQAIAGTARRRRRLRRLSYGRFASSLLTANQVRDNFPRIALYLHRRMEGDDWNTAARHVDKIFFDYSNLNRVLMVARRNMAPFVTFLAKSVPLLTRMSYEHPSFYSFEAKLQANLQQSSGQDPLNLAFQRSPTSPDVFNVPVAGGLAKWLGGVPGEGTLWDPQSATRMSALNLIPYSRGGSNTWESFALSAGQLAGGPAVDVLGGVYNFDTRRGEAYGDWRNTDPLSYNLIALPQAIGLPVDLAKIDQDPTNAAYLRYRVRSPVLSLLRAFDPYIPGTLGAYSYTLADLLTGQGVVAPVGPTGTPTGRLPWPNLIRDAGQIARGHQRLFGEGTGLPFRPESRQTAQYYFQKRNR